MKGTHMKINIYYGGRGLIDDPTLYVINKMEEVFRELRVTVERFQLCDLKNSITTLPQTLKDADGIILATIITMVICSFFWASNITFKHYFGMDKYKEYPKIVNYLYEVQKDILENILNADEKVIIFTQYVEMGKLIQRLISKKFKQDVLIGRVGGDKFMIFIKHLEDRNQLYPLSNEVKQYLEQIYTGATEERLLSCYTGVALYPADGKRFDILFQHSDTAIYVAKKKRKGSFVFYENCFLHLYDDEKEFYQNYNIDEKNQKHSKLNNELAALAVDMISNSGDINNTMQVFLTYCSDLIKVDQIRIYEVAENQNELYVSLSSRTNQSIVEKHIVYEEKDLIQFKAQFADGLFFAGDTGKIASIRVKLFLYEQGIHATAQCAFYRKNHYKWYKQLHGTYS